MVGNDVDEIVGHDRQVVVVDAEILNASRAAVDEAELVRFAGGDSELAVSGIGVAGRARREAAVERHSAVDDGVVGRLRLQGGIIAHDYELD